jgi:hypothetical protein
MRPAVTAFATPAKHRVKLAQPSAGPEPGCSVAVRGVVYKQWISVGRGAQDQWLCFRRKRFTGDGA